MRFFCRKWPLCIDKASYRSSPLFTHYYTIIPAAAVAAVAAAAAAAAVGRWDGFVGVC